MNNVVLDCREIEKLCRQRHFGPRAQLEMVGSGRSLEQSGAPGNRFAFSKRADARRSNGNGAKHH
jgi:hypothetical protein